MSDESTKFAEDFDNRVLEYNNWWRLVGNLSSIGNLSPKKFETDNPLYKEPPLNPQQRQAIKDAAHWKRVEESLARILEGDFPSRMITKNDLRASKAVIKEMYTYYREVYLTSTLRR